MSGKIETQVLVIGGGLSGLTLAALLGRAGVDVTVLDREPPVTQLAAQYDARTTALSAATRRVLEAAGAWDKIARHAEPMLDIRVADGGAPLFLHFESAGHGEAFGWNLENLHLRRTLFENARGIKGVRHLAPVEIEKFFRDGESVGAVLKDGRRIAAPLMVGADGRGSAVRRWLDIPVTARDYGQAAIVCNIAHDKDHENVAVEHFLPAGPFAVLPLAKAPLSQRMSGEDPFPPPAFGGRGRGRECFRSSIVWTVGKDEAQGILKMPEKDFDAALQELCGGHLGRVKRVSTARAYPLSLMHAAAYTAPRVALMAEAAHVIHPIAGQGLNLSMRDAALLAEIVVDRLRVGLDAGAFGALKEYENIRRADTRLMAGFTDVLNGLFSNNLKTVALARGLGLGIVEKTPFLKRFFARQAMGLGGKQGRILHKRAL